MLRVLPTLVAAGVLACLAACSPSDAGPVGSVSPAPTTAAATENSSATPSAGGTATPEQVGADLESAAREARSAAAAARAAIEKAQAANEPDPFS